MTTLWCWCSRTPSGPAGAWRRAPACRQEESLFRRTALFRHLDRSMYPIEQLAAIYAPSVPVSSSYDGCVGIEFSFVACPGLKMPPTGPDGRLLEPDADLLRKKVELIFQIARDNGHRSLVLGALGCGAFGCPPRHVAGIFRDVIRSEAVRCSGIRRVVFAITGANRGFFEDSFDEHG
jgi:uncharacterized protein (TIGR02452 family)